MSWVSFVWTGESVGHATKGSHGASAIKVVVRPRPRRRWLFAFNFRRRWLFAFNFLRSTHSRHLQGA